MIQRIQTLYLLLASGSFGASFLAPFATSEIAVPATVLADSRFEVADNALMSIGLGAAALATLAAIFLYRNRRLQIRSAWAALALAVLGVIAGVIAFMQDGATIGAVEVEEQIGVGLPVIGALATVLGVRGIGRDEKLVRSADRLR